MKQESPTITDSFWMWLKIGLLSFGGPAGQMALMHREIVERKGWLSEKQYLNALGFCMLLPGPEAMQLATYAGWRLHGVIGGLIAGLLFVIPGALVILVLAAGYVMFGTNSLVAALFLGIKSAVVMIVIQALIKVGRRALSGWHHWLIALCAFIGIFALNLPFPLIVGIAAIIGFMQGRSPSESTITDQRDVATPIRPKWTEAARPAVLWLIIWLLPLALVGLVNDFGILASIGVFFSKLAVVTFGGAYAGLAYLGQDVVDKFHWLTTTEMMDGLGLAETTPGPLILVTEFVGFIAGFRGNGDASFGYGVAGAIIALWATFAPCFLWIFTGAPYIEWITAQPRLQSALAAITAAVVGVIANLSIWFAAHVFFADVVTQSFGFVRIIMPSTPDLLAMLMAAISAFLLFKLKWDVWYLVLAAAIMGWGTRFI
ncbi:MAG: chromate efflux transporter [Candidatus Puniceispirillum sp.]